MELSPGEIENAHLPDLLGCQFPIEMRGRGHVPKHHAGATFARVVRVGAVNEIYVVDRETSGRQFDVARRRALEVFGLEHLVEDDGITVVGVVRITDTVAM